MPSTLCRQLAVAAFAIVLPVASAHAQLAPAAPRDTTTREYRGSYQRGFEQSWFMPCDAPRGDQAWWVTLTDEALQQRDSILAALSFKAVPTDGLAVRWRGTISPKMPAGHMGKGSRYMLVTEVIDIRPLSGSGLCGTPA